MLQNFLMSNFETLTRIDIYLKFIHASLLKDIVPINIPNLLTIKKYFEILTKKGTGPQNCAKND